MENGSLVCDLDIVQGSALSFGLLSDGYDFAMQEWSYALSFVENVSNTVIHVYQGTQADLVVEVPYLFAESLADFDTWLSTQTISHTYDSSDIKCIAQMSTGAPFADERRSLTIAHDCDATMSITVTFPGFTGEMLTDSRDHGSECSMLGSSLICELTIMKGSAQMFGLLSDGYDFATSAWTHSSSFASTSDNAVIHVEQGTQTDLIIEVPYLFEES